MRLSNCAGCGNVFGQERKQGRPRRYCDGCAPDSRRLATPSAVVPLPGVKPDPPVRADGRCAGPGCRKQRTVSEQARKYAGVQLDLDPFCSTRCCRKWHGTELPETGTEAQAEAGAKGGRMRAAMLRGESGWDDEAAA